MFVLQLTALASGHLFKRLQQALDDPRLGLNLEASGASGPGGVAAEHVLLGRRDVSLSAVGELIAAIACTSASL